MQNILIFRDGERLGRIKFHQDGGCSTSGTIGEWDFPNMRELLFHLSGFDISFQDMYF